MHSHCPKQSHLSPTLPKTILKEKLEKGSKKWRSLKKSLKFPTGSMLHLESFLDYLY